MSKFQIVDMFQRNTAPASGTSGTTDVEPQPTIIEADSIDEKRDGVVVFYNNGLKTAVACLGAGFIVQKLDASNLPG